MRPKRLCTILTCAAAIGGTLSASAVAAPGAFDPSFGTVGRVVSDEHAGGDDRGRAVAAQPDGKLVVGVEGPYPEFSLVRLRRDGERDSTFGTGGRVDTGQLLPRDVAVQADGRILVAGRDIDPARGSRFAVARYNPDGSPDGGFGSGGEVVVSFPPTLDLTYTIATRLELLPDGRIVAAGEACETEFGSSFRSLAVARLRSDGSLDQSFSGDGLAQVQAGTECFSDLPHGLAVRADGAVYVATGTGGDMFVARLSPGGGLDPDFGSGGTARTDVRGSDSAVDAVLQSDGKLVVAGSFVDGGAGGFALVRHLADGSLDSGFDGDGKVATDTGGLSGTTAAARALGLQADGRLVAAGCTERCGAGSAPALARYRPDGSLDASFAGDGTLATSFGHGAGAVQGLAIQPDDDRIVIAGDTIDGGDRDVAAARFVARTADVAVSASADAEPVTVGESLRYTLTVSNAGPDVARSVRLDDALSTRVGYASSSASQGGCTPAAGGRALSCSLGDLAAGARATVTITATADRTGRATNSASVAAPVEDGDESDNAAFVTTTIAAAPAAAPAPAPGAPPAPPPAPPPAGGLPDFPAKLEIARARVLRSPRRLSVLAPITARASGNVRARFHAASRVESFEARIDARNRRVRIDRRIPAEQARLGTGILTLSYAGDENTQPQEVRLRAASQPAKLAAQRPRIDGGRLTASGAIAKRARGVVRLQVLFEPPSGTTRVLEFKAPIRDGRYRFDERLPADVQRAIAARRGVVHSYTLFTGYMPARIRGEMQSFQILGER